MDFSTTPNEPAGEPMGTPLASLPSLVHDEQDSAGRRTTRFLASQVARDTREELLRQHRESREGMFTTARRSILGTPNTSVVDGHESPSDDGGHSKSVVPSFEYNSLLAIKASMEPDALELALKYIKL